MTLELFWFSVEAPEGLKIWNFAMMADLKMLTSPALKQQVPEPVQELERLGELFLPPQSLPRCHHRHPHPYPFAGSCQGVGQPSAEGPSCLNSILAAGRLATAA